MVLPKFLANSAEYRSVFRFLLRTFWLLFLHKIFGDNLLFSTSSSSQLTSSTEDFDLLSHQSQQLLAGDAATLWLSVYSCFYFASGIFFITTVFGICSFLSERVFQNNKTRSNNKNQNDADEGSSSFSSSLGAISNIIVSPLLGFEFCPRSHIFSNFAAIFADVAVVAFVTPASLLLVWPTIELALAVATSILKQVNFHIVQGTFNVRFLMRLLQSRMGMASLFLLGIGFFYGLGVTIAEFGLFHSARTDDHFLARQQATSKSTGKHENAEIHHQHHSFFSFLSNRGSSGLWMYIHSMIFMTILRTVLLRCFTAKNLKEVFFFWSSMDDLAALNNGATRNHQKKDSNIVSNDNNNNNNNAESATSNFSRDEDGKNNAKQYPGISELIEYGGVSLSGSMFIALRAVFRSVIVGCIFATVSKFFRVNGCFADSIIGIAWFVATEMFVLPSVNEIEFVVFWTFILLVVVVACWTNANNITTTSTSAKSLFWTLFSCLSIPFHHGCAPHATYYFSLLNIRNNNNIPHANENANISPKSLNSSSTSSTIFQEVPNHIRNQFLHPQRQGGHSSSNNNKFVSFTISFVVLFTGSLVLSFSMFENNSNHFLLVFLWSVLAIPLFIALNHVFTQNAFADFFGKYNLPKSPTSSLQQQQQQHDIDSTILKNDLENFLSAIQHSHKNETKKNLDSSDDEQTESRPSSSSAKKIFSEIWSTPHERKLLIFFCCTSSFMLIEGVVGSKYNSLGLLSDAFHMFVDSSSILFGLIASYAAKWKPTRSHPFGYAKYEALSGMLNGVLLVVVCVHILQEAFVRLQGYRETMASSSSGQASKNNFEDHHHHNHQQHSHNHVVAVGGVVLPVSVIGLVMNIVGVLFFQGHDHAGECEEENQKTSKNNNNNEDDGAAHKANMRGVFLHVLADLLGSVAVVISSVIISFYPSLYIVDTICAMIVSVLILIASWSLLSSTYAALM